MVSKQKKYTYRPTILYLYRIKGNFENKPFNKWLMNTKTLISESIYYIYKIHKSLIQRNLLKN